MEVRDRAEDIAEDADHSTVKRHILDNSSGFLNSTPPVSLINDSENVRFIFKNRKEGVTHQGHQVNKHNPSDSCGTLLLITDEKCLILIGKCDKDLAISIPVGTINESTFDTALFGSKLRTFTGVNELIINTTNGRYNVPIYSEKMDLKHAIDYLRSTQNLEPNEEVREFEPTVSYDPREHSDYEDYTSVYDELEDQIMDRKEEGWEIEEIDTDNRRVIMKNTEGGSIGGHLLGGLTAGIHLGLGNVAYSKLSKMKNAERIVLRPKEDAPNNVVNPDQLDSISAKLRDLKELHDDGIIDEDEFKAKKEELLDKY